MYTSYIGKYFIELYNKKLNQKQTAESFFDQVLFPLFFDHEQHLMHVGNSPFFQKPKKEDVEKAGSPSKAQYANLKEKMENDRPNMSIFVGYRADDIKKVTTGQMTDLPDLHIDKEEMYASWIGQALAIGVSGGNVFLLKDDAEANQKKAKEKYSGNVFLLKDDEVLWNIYQGWEYYRRYLMQTPSLKGRQIETWNGNWLAHTLSSKYDKAHPMQGFEVQTAAKKGELSISTISWSQLLYRLSLFLKEKQIIVYAYSLAQMNTTLGFITLYLHEVRRPLEFKHKLIDFKDFKSEVSISDIEKFETFYTFKNACKMGSIGLKALEPKALREYMPKGTMPFAGGEELDFKKEKSIFNYEIYQIWIMATLNKTQLLELASQLAQILHAVEKLGEKGKKEMSNLSKETRESKNVRQFIEYLSMVIEYVGDDDKQILRQIVEEVLAMPSDNFPLFITLVRFEYNYQESYK